MMHVIYAFGPPLTGAIGLVFAVWVLRLMRKLVAGLTALTTLVDAQLSHNGGSTLLDRVASIEKTLKDQAFATAASEAAKAQALLAATDALRVETQHLKEVAS